jgi:AcrR family transcriptional regulator
VLLAAMVLVDEDGIEALTMRGLGRALGVEAMSLYNHVADKDDLLVGILELAVGEIDQPTGGTDWKADLRQGAISAHDALVRHPWAPGLLVSQLDATGPARLRWMDAVLRVIREADFAMLMTDHAFHLLDSYVLGFALQEVSLPRPTGDLAELATTFLRGLPADDYPYLVEHIQHHIDSAHYDEGDFEFGLDLILDGLDQLRDTA